MLEWIISSAVLILIVIALRFILKGKISLRLQYALWAIVLLRLIIPVSFGSSIISIGNLTQKAAETEAGQIVSALSDTELPSKTYRAAYDEVAKEYAEKGVDISEIPYMEFSETIDYEIMARMNGSRSIRDIIQIVWIIGIAAVGLVLISSNIRFAVKLKKSRLCLEEQAVVLPVYVSPDVDTPCLFGLFPPVIYLTPEAAADDTILRHSIQHELTHFRHGDHFWSLLRGVCLALHWYNPLVWRAAALSKNDAELACDEATIRRIGENERSEYGRTLIEMTCQKRPALLLTATTMTGSTNSIKERIAMIAKKPKTAIYTLIAVILIAVVAAGCTFTGAKETAPDIISETDETDKADKPEPDTTLSVSTEAVNDLPSAVIDYAQDFTQIQLDFYTDELGYDITEAKITGLTQINTGTSGINSGINMYLLEYRFRAADPNEIMLAGGMRMDGDCITEWGSTGQPYLLLHWNNDGDKTVWERICVTNTLTMQEEYSMPEMLEQYGNIYTAAAMELYAKHVGDNKNAEQSDIVLTGFSVRADGNPSEVGLKWAEAFASQYTELPDGHPFKSRDCEVFSCELTAESCISSPKTLVFNMKFACHAVDPDAFEQQYGGWAVPLEGQKQYTGWMEFGWFVELKNTGSDEWTCTDVGTGGFGGWGYLNYEDANDLEFFMDSMFSGDLDTPENLLRVLPLFDWRNFYGKDWNAMYKFLDKYCLTEGQVYGPEATRMWKDVYPEDQAYRNMYVMLTALNSDGAYADGLSGILKKQQSYDPELFEKCLQNLTQAQRDTVEKLVVYGQSDR